MEDCIKKIGFDVDLVKKEMDRYEKMEDQLDYLSNLESKSREVLYDVDNILILLENHIEKNLNKDGFDKIKSGNVINLNAFSFVSKKIKSIKNPNSKKVLDCILPKLVGKTFMETDKIFEKWINKIDSYRDKLFFMIEQGEKLTEYRTENRIEKFLWLSDEESLLNLFNSLVSNGFLEPLEDLYESLALHFNLNERKKIPIQSKLPFKRFNWLNEEKDLAYFHLKLNTFNLLEFTNSKHILFTDHFVLRGAGLKSKNFGDYYNQVKKRPNDYIPNNSLENILKHLPKS